jgi:hypothetical protein
VGIVILAAGFFLYVDIAPQWQQAQNWLVQVAGAISPGIQQRIESIRLMYFSSIGAMLLGSILTMVGLLSPRQTTA